MNIILLTFTLNFLYEKNKRLICVTGTARFTEFSNLRLGVYTPYAHEKTIQSLTDSPVLLIEYYRLTQ